MARKEGGKSVVRGVVGLGVRVVDHTWVFSNMYDCERGGAPV